jgi:Co/Zn/Cd efflux system component
VGASCCRGQIYPGTDVRYRRVLWIALAINLGMFAFETGAGLSAGSVALRADALDFLADGANFATSLFLLRASLRVRAMAALAKAGAMAAFGLWLFIATAWHALSGTVPEAPVMSLVGIAALAANGTILGLLAAYRRQDRNMSSVWICTRNDALGNLAVLLAAAGVFGTGRGWPDGVVATFMASLALWGALQIVLNAVPELRPAEAVTLA